MAAAKEEMQDPTPIAVDPIPADAAPVARVEAQAARDSMLNIMRDKFKTEKRVTVKVHAQAPVQVQVNGYSFLIREGEKVEVPESIRDILDEAGYI